MDIKVKKALLMVLFSYSSLINCTSSHVLTFFIDEYPNNTLLERKKNSPHTLYKNRKNNGIFCTYYGYKTISDANGQVTFPLKHNEKKVHILVMNDPKPQFMLFNTIDHFIVPENIPYSYYSIEQKEDKRLKLFFWSTQEVPLEDDRHIPLDTIVIYAHPSEIYIPTGVSMTQEGGQLVLPTLYAKEHIKLSKNVIQFLDNSEFFAPIQHRLKVEESNELSTI